jgi:hypothetical protein
MEDGSGAMAIAVAMVIVGALWFLITGELWQFVPIGGALVLGGAAAKGLGG